MHTLASLHCALLLAWAQPLPGEQLSSVQTLPSSQLMALPAPHLPPSQVSPSVHRLLSVQTALLVMWPQPAILSQLSSVQGLPSSQLATLPGTQAPALQTSPTVHTVPSSQGTVLFVDVHAPVTGLQFSVVQGFLSSQVLGPLGVQTPTLQISPTVQLLLSSHLAVLKPCSQPAIASQLSSVHGLPSSQLIGLPALHKPLAHTSPLLQTVPSSQGSVLLVKMQPDFTSQLSVVHNLPSSQIFWLPGLQAPLLHWSFTVHTLLSVQNALLFATTQPFALSQLSSVHPLPSSHTMSPPGLHALSLQVSPLVQALPSSHGCTLLKWAQPLLASQPSSVHKLLSLQSIALPGMHLPPSHASSWLHTLASVQGALLFLNTQPLSLSQLSSVQTLPSSQGNFLPGVHLLSAQMSLVVQASLSSQATMLAM